ncbi:MAG: multicopper oxidase domain-containing protein [Alphaproteobacteria bacterium]|nr:multicopper oxidase domain-containing protein [Alphaproteobacteria bacterium]
MGDNPHGHSGDANAAQIVHRRDLLRYGGMAALAAGVPASPSGTNAEPADPPGSPPRSAATARNKAAEYTIRIGTGLVELGPDATVSTKLYNGQFPGPLLRLSEGRRVVVDIHNDTDTPEQLHWHGQLVPVDVDGAAEEGTPFIPAHGMRRIAFTPGPHGFRFYHTHLHAGADLSAGLYSGQAGPVYIEPAHDPGAFDREVFLTLKEFGPFLSRTEMPLDFLAPTGRVPGLHEASEKAMLVALKAGLKPGYEAAYNFFSINGRMLAQGEPVRVQSGERVLFHVLNASASEIRSLALPGHVFRAVALDGNPVPHPLETPVLWVGPAERVSVLVEMKQPGIWVLGDLADEDRSRGMGIVVEYAGATGKPQWRKPPPFRWDYGQFGNRNAASSTPDETIEMTFTARIGAREGFDEFMINGAAFSMDTLEPMFRLSLGRRYRLHMINATDDIHPVHLHRHSFEITSIAGVPTSGVTKDVAMLGSFQEMTIDFTADRPGRSLFHCHMQSHMDFGFMTLFDCS